MLRDNRGDITSIMIGIMVAIIVFMVALMAIMPTINTACNYQPIVNETFNTSAQDVYVQLDNTDIQGSVVVTNITGTTTYTVTTDYLMNNTDGTILSKSTGAMSNYTDYYVDYNYKHESYIESAITRMIVKLLPLMLAVGALVIVAGVMGKD